jgi:integrase
MKIRCITEAIAEALPVEEKDYSVTEENLTGFSFRIRKSGQKSFYLKVKRSGKTINKKLGIFPEISVSEAKRFFQRELFNLNNVRVDSNNTLTTSKAIDEYSCSERFLLLGKKSQVEYLRYVNEFLDVTMQDDVVTLFKDRKLIRKVLAGYHTSGKSVKANRMKSAISSFAWYLMDEDVIESNPTIGLRTYEEKPRERFLSDNELRLLFSHMKHDSKAKTLTKDSIRLYLLTGCRLDELRLMHSRELEDDCWTLPKGRIKKARKDCLIPLTETMSKILGKYPRKRGLVLTHRGDVLGHETVTQSLERMCKAVGIVKATTHDLRRTVGTILARLRVDALMRKRLLNHQLKDVTEDVYTFYDFYDEKLEALQKLDGHMVSLGL